jgi:DNA polymerase V
MFALCDCNNFYASAERLFNPSLNGKPVVVLSNNDGCVIARSEEAKRCGIKMADPEFLIRDMIKEHDVHVFSSNYVLYGDISERVMHNLSRWFPRLDVYSVDEAFGWLGGVTDLHNYIPQVRKEVVRNTGIPVSIGVAPSKTLAKLANKLAKKGSGSLVLDTPEAIREAVKDYPIHDLWGVGRKYYEKLTAIGIKTVGQLRELPEQWFKQHMTIQGQRMYNELWGRPCIPFDNMPESAKCVSMTRSFRNYVEDIDTLNESITQHASGVGEKLRKANLRCLYLQVFLYTNEHREDHPQHFPSYTHKLAVASNNAHDMVRIATTVTRMIFESGMKYRKSGVIATGLVHESELQLNLFRTHDGGKLDALSKTIDTVNLAYGRHTVRMASEGYTKEWSLKRDFLSKEYTTNWDDIVKVK